MRVAVLYSAVSADAPLEDQDTLVQVETVSDALTRLGHEPVAVSSTLDLAGLREELLRLRPNVVFNLVESLAEADSLVYLPLAVLDVMRLPYTGGRTEALFLTTHKLQAKERLRQAGLPTPSWMESRTIIHEEHEEGTDNRNRRSNEECGEDNNRPSTSASVLSSASPSCPSCSSWIIKGVWDQASRGMDDDAVLKAVNATTLKDRLRQRAAESGRPCFAEQFIEGREFNLSVLAGPKGPQVLPPAEIDFSAFPAHKPRIVGHRAKWQVDSFEYNHTPRRFDFPAADGPLLAELRRLAASCWTLFELRGWVRVDFRVDAAGQPWILEINANPCLSPDAGFAAALEQASIPFDEAIRRIVEEVAP
jgi:D-alanine-D-alanine ligase